MLVSVVMPALLRSVLSSVSSAMMAALVSLTSCAVLMADLMEPFASVNAVPRAATVRLVCALAWESRFEPLSNAVEDCVAKAVMPDCVLFSNCEAVFRPAPA